MKKNITIAIQKKGRLADGTITFFDNLNIIIDNSSAELLVPAFGLPMEFLKLRDDDIPRSVYDGLADFGIVGKNVLLESGLPLITLQNLQFGICKLVIAVPIKSNINNIYDLEAERIATSYPNILSDYLLKNGISASVLNLNGSVEAAPAMGLSDAICDITQTGTTLRENNLRQIATVLKSEAVLITNETVGKSLYSERYKWFIDKLNLNWDKSNLNNKILTNTYAYSKQ